MSIQYASCPLDCFDGCRFQVELQDDRIVKIQADPGHSVTAGFICNKGRNHLTRLYSSERITKPLIRDNGVLKPISMDNALNIMADRINQVVNRYGSTALMHYTGSGSSGLLNDMGLRFFNAIGGATLTEGSICWGSGLAAQKLDFGQPKAHSWDDLVNSQLIVLWGRDPHVTNQHLWPYIEKARKNGSKLMVVNPLLVSASKHADLVLRPQPGSDGILALALAQIIINEDLVDQSFIEKNTTGYNEFYSLANNLALDEAVQLTGLTKNEIRMAAKLYASCQPASIIFGYGLQRYANGGHTVRYIDALAALTGNLGVAGGGANYAHQAWAMDLNDISGTNLAKVERRLPMASLASAIMTTADPPLQLINISGGNPVTQHPDSNLMVQALKQIPMVVVTDMFMTDTAQLADLVLPCTSFLEETNIFKSSWHYYLHYNRALIKPTGECLPDYEIYQKLAVMMGINDFGQTAPDNWIRWVISPLTAKYGLTLEELKEKPWLHPEANLIPWAEHTFATISGKYQFVKQGIYCPQAKPEQDYPWRLMTPHQRDRMHSQGFEQDIAGVIIEINPLDASRVGVVDDGGILVITPTGQLRGRARISQRILPGVAVIAQGSWLAHGGGVNQLTREVLPDLGQGTPHYDCCCRLQAT